MGHSSECQSSPGWGVGVPPPPWEGRVHLEQQEGRGRGEAAGVSWCPVSAEIMEDEVGGQGTFSWPNGAQSASSTEPSAGGNEHQGPEDHPSRPNQCDRDKARPGKGEETYIPRLPTQKPQAMAHSYQLTSSRQALEVSDYCSISSVVRPRPKEGNSPGVIC